MLGLAAKQFESPLLIDSSSRDDGAIKISPKHLEEIFCKQPVANMPGMIQCPYFFGLVGSAERSIRGKAIKVIGTVDIDCLAWRSPGEPHAPHSWRYTKALRVR